MEKPADFIQEFIRKHSKRFDYVLDKLKIISAGDGHCLAELLVEEQHTDAKGALHSGLAATIIDTVSSYGLLTHKDCYVPGVTVELHATYVKEAQIGDEISIDSRMVEQGETLAFLEVVISNKNTGQVLVRGRQTRYLMRSQKL